MNELLCVTELLYSCWILGDTEGGERDLFPTQHVCAYALKKAVDDDVFPEWVAKRLHFAHDEAGCICAELPIMEDLACQLKFTAPADSSYTRMKVVVGKPIALRCLSRFNIHEEDGIRWGVALRRAAAQFEERMLAMDVS